LVRAGRGARALRAGGGGQAGRNHVAVAATWLARIIGKMKRQAAIVLYVLAMVAIVVGVDILFFKHHLWERLIVNVGIVLVFGVFALRFLKRP
jgi:hypothetical protein